MQDNMKRNNIRIMGDRNGRVKTRNKYKGPMDKDNAGRED